MGQVSQQDEPNAEFADRCQVRAATALLLLDAEIVQRSDVRRLMPEGPVRSRVSGRRCNIASKHFLQASRRLSDKGLIVRSPETFQVPDREALRQLVANNLRSDTVKVIKAVLGQWRKQRRGNAQQPIAQELNTLVRSYSPSSKPA